MSNFPDYPIGSGIASDEKIKRALTSYEDEAALKAVSLIIGQNEASLREIKARIVKNCGEISDGDLGQDSRQFQDLRQAGIDLYDLGGFVLMKLFCDQIAGEYAQMKWRTDKGNSFLIGSLCNAAWNRIGDWVA